MGRAELQDKFDDRDHVMPDQLLPFSRLTRSNWIFLVLLCAVLAGCVYTPAEPASEMIAVAPIGGAAPTPARVSREQLQVEVSRFADRYQERINLETDRIRRNAATPDARWFAIGWQLGSTEAVSTISTGPNPVENLLDMLILVSLTREQLESYWLPEVFGEEHGQDLLSATLVLERDIWSIADAAITPTQQDNLRQVIREWTEANPDNHYFWSVRLAGISGQRAAELDQVVRTGGLLGEAREARRTADEIRDLGERMMSYMKYSVALMRLNAQFAVYDVIGQPEVSQMLASSKSLTESAERFAAIAETLPNKELEVVNQLMAGLTVQRQELLDSLLQEEAPLRGLLADLRESLVVGTEVTKNINETVEVAERLSMYLKLGEDSDEPLTPMQLRLILSDASQTATAYNLLLQEANTLVATPAWEQRVGQLLSVVETVEKKVDGLVYLSFALGAGLIVIFFIGLFVYRYATAQWVTAKLGDRR